jgi:hypothetical protein
VGGSAPGRKQHYVPAALIGAFSPDATPGPLRKRKVWVARRGSAGATFERAENVGYANGLYPVGHQNVDVDAHLSVAEPSLLPAVDAVRRNRTGEHDLRSWVVLVDYVVTLFARSPLFPANLRRRLLHVVGPGRLLDRITAPVVASEARLFEVQRIGVAVALARWCFFETDRPMILNDRGAAPMLSPWGTTGYAVPLGPNFGVMLGAQSGGPRVDRRRRRIWIPVVTIGVANTEELNTILTAYAMREVYATRRPDVESAAGRIGRAADHAPDDPFDAAQLLGIASRDRRRGELLLPELRALVGTPSAGLPVFYPANPEDAYA